MSAYRPPSDADITIRDRRELPFFQVRLRAVQAIRNETTGPRRLRAIGFYALLCQLANEQRHTGEHRVVRATYETLAARGQMSKRTVKLLLDALEQANVVRYERLADRSTGAVISLFHLLILDEPWLALTVATADQLATPRPGGHLLRDLGLIVVLLEFCVEQRSAHGGLAAEVMRSDIASRSGLGVDRVDDCNHALERARLLHIERRRGANGGPYLPSVYTVREAPSAATQGGITEPPARQNGTEKAANGYRHGGTPVPARPPNGTRKAADRYPDGGDSATLSTLAPPSTTRPRSAVEATAIENNPPSRSRAAAAAEEGAGRVSAAEQLCDALVASWAPALGDSPRRQFQGNRQGWLAAAEKLLQRHPQERLDGALAYMVTDEILGSEALTMPGFAKVADKLIARAHARRMRFSARASGGVADRGLSWQDAKVAIERAIRRHGRDGRAEALAELSAENPLLPQFVDRVKWSALCEQPLRYAEPRYAETWAALTNENTNGREDATA